MLFTETVVRIGDTVEYVDTWSERPDKLVGKYRRKGTVVGIYPHHVLLQTRKGYKVSVTNADLHCNMGWK